MLLDTDVLVDVARRFPPAIQWLGNAEATVEYFISGFTAMELIAGCDNQRRLQATRKILSRYTVLWLTPEECSEAMVLFERFHLSHNAGLIDTLVGYTAIVHAMPVATFNNKHFRFLPRIEIVEPYSRHQAD